MAKKEKKNKVTFGKKELRPLLYGIFKEHPTQSYNYKQLAQQLGIKNMNAKQLMMEVLYEMKKEQLLGEPSTGKFKLHQATTCITGIIDMTAKGTAFLIPDDNTEDIFIPVAGLHHALNGDRVKAVVYARHRQRRPEGEVVEVLERKKENFVGEIQISKHFAFLVPSGKQLPYDIFVPLNELHGARNGEKVVVKITEWLEEQKNPVGTVVQVLGQPGNNDTEMNAIMAEFELPVEFPANVKKAAEKIPLEITRDEISQRKDFREVTTFTIDPADAKDFDDALSVRSLKNGNFEIGVHIADVSHYIQPDSILDKEAYDRATSVYLVDRTIPMLPERLSNGVCSLRPREEKLCFSAVFEMRPDATVVKQWFGRTVICSDRRFTYEEAQAIIEGAEGDFKAEILIMNDLAQQLRKARFRDGAVDFDRVEVRFNIDENGKPLSVYFKRSLEANKLIEEFMLLANRKVAEFIGKIEQGKKTKTFVYRVHEAPNPDKVAEFSKFVSRFGYRLPGSTPRQLSTGINKLMVDIKDRPEQNMIETLAIRTMAKATYSTENVGHYGLAFDYYTHFTSPIRRYPDVMVHRLLQRYLDGGRSANQEAFEEKCKHSSDMEQVAANAERASIKYKQVEFMADKIGETFLGTISGVTQWGFYVELNESKSEGLVPMTELSDDYYEFDEENYCIVGRHHRKVYQLGDQVLVRIMKANLVSRQLDFALASTNEKEGTPPRVNRQGNTMRPQPERKVRRGRKGSEVNPRKKGGRAARR